MALSTYQIIFPFLITHLNHPKSVYRTLAKNCIVDLWLAVPLKIESAVRDFLLENLNNIKNIFIVNEVLKIIIVFHDNNPNTNLSQYLVSLTKLYQFSSFSRSSINVSINDLSKELLQIAILQHTTNKTQFLEVANSCGVNKTLISSVIFSKLDHNSKKSSGDVLQTFDRQPTQSQPPLSFPQTQIDADYFKNDPTIETHVSTMPTYSVDTQKELSSIVNGLTLYKLEKLSPLEFSSLSSLFNATVSFEKDFEGRETEFNWSKRENHVTKLRRMIRSELLTQSTENQKEFLSYIKDNLIDGILKSLNSLRTTLSTSGCKIIKELFQIFDISSFDGQVLELLFKNVIKLSITTKKINTSNSHAVVCCILDKVFGSKVFNFRILNLIYDYSNDKNISPRIFSASWVSVILLKHHNDLQNFHDQNSFSSSGENSALKIIEKIIDQRLGDSSPLVREQIRKTFWLFYKLYPKDARIMYDKWPTTVTKLLDKSKPNDVNLITYDQAPNLRRAGSLNRARSNSAASQRSSKIRSKNHSYGALQTDNINASLFRSKSVIKSRSVSDLSKMPGPGSAEAPAGPTAIISSSRDNELNNETRKLGSNEFGRINPGIGKPIRISRKPSAQQASIENTSTNAFNSDLRFQIKSHSSLGTRYGKHSASGSSFLSNNHENHQHSHDQDTFYSAKEYDNLIRDNSNRFVAGEPKFESTPILHSLPNEINEEINGNSSSKEDTDSEINNSMASKLVISEQKNVFNEEDDNIKQTHSGKILEKAVNGEEDVEMEEEQQEKQVLKLLEKNESMIEKVSRMLKSVKTAEQMEGVKLFIELVSSNIQLSMSDYDLLSSALSKLCQDNVVCLFDLVDISLLPKFVDIFSLSDFLVVLCYYQQHYDDTESKVQTTVETLVELVTYDEVVSNLLATISKRQDKVVSKYGLSILQYLISDHKADKAASNKYAIINNVILNLILIWQSSTDLVEIKGLVQQNLIHLDRGYSKLMERFFNENFDNETDKSTNVLVKINRQEFAKIIGKQLPEPIQQEVLEQVPEQQLEQKGKEHKKGKHQSEHGNAKEQSEHGNAKEQSPEPIMIEGDIAVTPTKLTKPTISTNIATHNKPTQTQVKSLTSNWDVTLSGEGDTTIGPSIGPTGNPFPSGSIIANRGMSMGIGTSNLPRPPTLLNSGSRVEPRLQKPNLQVSPIKEEDYGISPVKISDLKKGLFMEKAENSNDDDDDGDAKMTEENKEPKFVDKDSDSDSDSLGEMTRIIPYFKPKSKGFDEISYQELRANNKNKEKRNNKSTITKKTIVKEDTPVNKKEAAKIANLIEQADPLKLMNKSSKKIFIYQDTNTLSDIYNQLIEKQIKKYTLMNYKQYGDNSQTFSQTEELEDNFFKITVSNLKTHLSNLSGGGLKLKDFSMLIFVVNKVATDLSQNKHSKFEDWLLKNRGFDEIFNSVLYYVNTQSITVTGNDSNVIEILLLLKLLMHLSKESGANLFNINKINKYWVMSDKIIQGLKTSTDIHVNEKAILLLEEMPNCIAFEEQSCMPLLVNIIKSLTNTRTGSAASMAENATIIKYYLKSLSKVLINLGNYVNGNIDHEVLSLIESNIFKYLQSEDGEVRREVILIYSMIYKIEKLAASSSANDASDEKNKKILKRYGSLEKSQQRLISHYSEFV